MELRDEAAALKLGSALASSEELELVERSADGRNVIERETTQATRNHW